MHKIFIISAFCLLSAWALVFGKESGDAENFIKKRLQDFTEAINQHRVEALPTFWTQDASLVNPTTSEVYKGKKEITAYLQKRSQEIAQRKLSFAFTPSKITFPAQNQAVVEGVVEIKAHGQLIQRHVRKIGLVNLSGQWYINDVREIEAMPAPSAFSHLKELEWLIGNWKDSDQDVTITFSAKWDKFKNFIVQEFKMEIYGQTIMEGMQIIGWDPIEKHVHSWIYDSDGGFGQGVWMEKNGSWQVSLNYTFSDGSVGEATNIYSQINAQSYRYTSVDRSIDGEPIDNIPPITVQKE